MAADLCSPRGSQRAARPPSRRQPRAVGQIGPTVLCLSGTCRPKQASREPTRRRAPDRSPRLFHAKDTHMTATTLVQQKRTLVPDRLASIAADLPLESSVPALLVDGVTKRFHVGRKRRPVIAINDVSLRLDRGATVGILGANGSGKSTLIRLV